MTGLNGGSDAVEMALSSNHTLVTRWKRLGNLRRQISELQLQRWLWFFVEEKNNQIVATLKGNCPLKPLLGLLTPLLLLTLPCYNGLLGTRAYTPTNSLIFLDPTV